MRAFILLGTLSTVGLTAWNASADPMPEAWRPTWLHRAVAALAPESENLDSAHWASLINSFTDPTKSVS